MWRVGTVVGNLLMGYQVGSRIESPGISESLAQGVVAKWSVAYILRSGNLTKAGWEIDTL